MLPAKRIGVVRKDTPCPLDDHVRIKPSQDQTAFPIIHIIGNAVWLDVPVADCTFKVFKLACSNTIGNEGITASVTGWRCTANDSQPHS